MIVAVKHVGDCKNSARHSATEKVPFDVLFGNLSSSIRHIRPFGCRKLHQRRLKKVDRFAACVYEGLCLWHESGGVCHILLKNGPVRTKHFRAEEHKLAGMGIFSDVDSRNVDDESASVEIDIT